MKRITRRGFFGILGALGAAMACGAWLGRGIKATAQLTGTESVAASAVWVQWPNKDQQICVYCDSIDHIERGPLPGPYKDDTPHYACSTCLDARGAVSAWATT